MAVALLTPTVLGQFASPHEKKLNPPASPTTVPRLMENLDRGLVAVNQGEGRVFVSWRLLGTEAPEVAFNLYRTSGSGSPVKINAVPLTQGTNFEDTGVDLAQAVAYTVRAFTAGREQAASKPFVLPARAPARQYLAIPLRQIPDFEAGDISPADLDGDGEYELIVHQASRGRDNSQTGFTGTPILQAYKLDGTMLWQINLGHNIREGQHYTQFMVYDLDGDGRAELLCKTGDGSTDGVGKVIGNPNADWRSPDGSFVPVVPREPSKGHVMIDGVLSHGTTGNVLQGPEFLTVFDGLTGAAIDTVDYEPQRHPSGHSPAPEQLNDLWGDAYGNRMDRFLAAVAYFDGERPSVMFSRGYYTRTVLAAWDYRDRKLVKRWLFDTHDGARGFMYYEHQGNHSLTAADVDGDGRDEIVFGSAVIDDDGMGLYSTQLNHGDAQHVSDLDPTRPGMEILSIHEFNQHFYGMEMRDAATGEILWGKPSYDPSRCLSIDIDPRFPGHETWGMGPNLDGLYSAKGEEIVHAKPRSCSFGIWWDGDLLREIPNGNQISKWNWETGSESLIFTMEGAAARATGLRGGLTADILGDWREEQVVRSGDGTELRIYTTDIPTEHRLYTLMHDSQYRLSVALQNVAYNQPPHTSYFLGHGMAPIKQPNIRVFDGR